MASATGRRPQQAPEWTESALIPQEEWRLLHHYHPNLLLIGPIGVTAAIVAALRSRMRPPVINWSSGTSAPLPASLSSAGTLVLENVSALDREGQQRLISSLQDTARIQVVATSPVPLMPLVERSAFDRRLYYLLNVVLLDLS